MFIKVETLAALQRRPLHALYAPFADEGRMKGLAFAYDPSGYWVELVKRNKEANFPEKFNLGQTMLRVKDADKSLSFYAGMGMTKASRLDTQSGHVCPELGAMLLTHA